MIYPAQQDRLQAQIAKIQASGEVADPRTWITSFHVTKPSGKRYTYYRLVRTVRGADGKLKVKMVKYLGSAESRQYQEMQQAIARRNRIQALEREMQRLMQRESPPVVSGGKKKKSPTLTQSDYSLGEQLPTILSQIWAAIEQLRKDIERFSPG